MSRKIDDLSGFVKGEDVKISRQCFCGCGTWLPHPYAYGFPAYWRAWHEKHPDADQRTRDNAYMLAVRSAPSSAGTSLDSYDFGDMA